MHDECIVALKDLIPATGNRKYPSPNSSNLCSDLSNRMDKSEALEYVSVTHSTNEQSHIRGGAIVPGPGILRLVRWVPGKCHEGGGTHKSGAQVFAPVSSRYFFLLFKGMAS